MLDKFLAVCGSLFIVGGMIAQTGSAILLPGTYMIGIGLILLIIAVIIFTRKEESFSLYKEGIPRISLMGNCCSHDTTIQDYNKIDEHNRSYRNRHLNLYRRER